MMLQKNSSRNHPAHHPRFTRVKSQKKKSSIHPLADYGWLWSRYTYQCSLSLSHVKPFLVRYTYANKHVGQNHHINRDPSHNRPLPLSLRHRLVRKLVHAHALFLSTHLGPHIHLLQPQTSPSLRHICLRNRLRRVRCRALVHRFHHW